MVTLNVEVQTRNAREQRRFEVSELVIAGWAGRDVAAMEHHIRELEELGIARPRATPLFYRVSASRLATSEVLDVVGGDSSGEVECVLVASEGRLFVGVGSDHTDRKVEAYGVTVSKQICDKPVSSVFWPWDEVADHWDDLTIASFATIDGETVPYQEGSVAGLLHPEELIRKYTGGDTLADGTAMFCGTLPALGGVRPARAFEARLCDPVLSRELKLGYQVRELEIAD
ncbi:DUF2848 domain-containing protein [Pseudohoeflea coraliihabitans]|uniref:DUF2848 domain-containing protein n=1 Tax=Pseudohoeflea coraliihabitans TaxID=2860393 RepID=A0ABS6WSW6_9HYPH|nr:DUF2848 domain-containing protein [Pseudohoeflea sp. DP4N28-3]MBW3098160.1 DUF2848 domain-containing protein [Pseudohoeflea sp. DP4N28-3]